MPKKSLIIGIDGGTWTVLDTAIEQGYMPYLGELVAKGTSGKLLSTTPPKTAAAWSTFQTGLNPGQNGVFDFVYWDRHRKETQIVNATALQKTMWEYASDAKRKVATINVPMTYPVRPINGVTVSGILTPSLESDFTWPTEFKNELLAAVPDYHILNLKNIKHGTPHTEPEIFLDRLKQNISSRAQAALHLINKESFDLMMLHFQESDVVQHVMWGYMQQDHPLYSPRICSLIFTELYAHLDSKIRTVHEAFNNRAGKDSCLFVISDHGFQTHKNRFNLGLWLQQQGLLAIRKPDFLGNLKSAVRRLQGKRNPVAFDWKKTRAFSFSRGNDGFIYLLQNDPEKRQQTISQIQKEIMTIRDPDTNAQITQEVLLKEQAYSGIYLDRMPDLIIKPADGYSFTGNYTGNTELFQSVTKENDFHMGMHHQDGILVAHGANICQDKKIENAQLIDMAPTILAALEVPVPKQFEGSVLSDLFETPINESIQYSDTPGQVKQENNVYSKDDIGSIESRLRDLGYIE